MNIDPKDVAILGVSAFYHDSAAALTRGAEIVAAAQEERFSRRKHDPRFPGHAINYCMEKAFLEADELDAVAFYDNPIWTFDRVVSNAVSVAPSGREQWFVAANSILGTKLQIAKNIESKLGSVPRLLICDHHLSHAASAFYPSPFEEAAILTVDGVGEWATTTIGYGQGAEIDLLAEIEFPHSLGLLYSAFTYYCGFKVNSGEYKLMGLAPYGEPKYANQIRDHLIELKPDGSFRLNLEYFGFRDTEVMTNEKFHQLFGARARKSESKIEFRHMDLAASVQLVTEEAMMGLAREVKKRTGSRNLVMAGGVALNCVSNGKILASGEFDQIFIQPAAGDAGGALGAALLAAHAGFGTPRTVSKDRRDAQRGSLLGPANNAEEVEAWLERNKYLYEHITDRQARAECVAEVLDGGGIVGHCAGQMEFGPRALGARSILGDPRSAETQSMMNLKIKYRESFRPFAPIVLRERVSEYFDLNCDSPYMLLVAPVKEEIRRQVDKADFRSGEGNMIDLVNETRSSIPAVTHVDYSARVQTVDKSEDNADLRAVLEAFEQRTGCGVLVNTSFNVRGEPIVCTHEDAYRCFMRTEMDLLVLGEFVLEKAKQPEMEDNQDWKNEYEID